MKHEIDHIDEFHHSTKQYVMHNIVMTFILDNTIHHESMQAIKIFFPVIEYYSLNKSLMPRIHPAHELSNGFP